MFGQRQISASSSTRHARQSVYLPAYWAGIHSALTRFLAVAAWLAILLRTDAAEAPGTDATRSRVLPTSEAAPIASLGETWLAKSLQTHLDYSSLDELVAEKSHASPTLIRRLNPGIDWNQLKSGTALVVPNAEPANPTAKAAFNFDQALKKLDGFIKKVQKEKSLSKAERDELTACAQYIIDVLEL